jgi:hypothetical protein
MALTLESLAAQVDELKTAKDALAAEVADLKAASEPTPQTHVICTDCHLTIAVEDAILYPEPTQNDATRYVCADRKACAQRVEEMNDRIAALQAAAAAKVATSIAEAQARFDAAVEARAAEIVAATSQGGMADDV